jgi:uncharacterized membrane protein YdjX (TVP38/TMEM64 family)
VLQAGSWRLEAGSWKLEAELQYRVRRRPLLFALVLIPLIAGACFSYWTSGFVHALVAGTPDQGPWLQRVRDAVAAWGPLAPLIYTLVVIVEVVVAPIPGALLYAPGGAIFGGFAGGSLSLLGNVIGAAIACALGGWLGEKVLRDKREPSRLEDLRGRLTQRAIWVVLLLRANPLTSSDLVSYAAGVAGVPPWKVAIGTLGMAPLCYIQAYFAEQVFTLVPGWLLAAGGAILIVVVILLFSSGTKPERADPG